MSIVKNFDNFTDAEKFNETLKRYGAETKIYATWSRKEREYIITVNATVK